MRLLSTISLNKFLISKYQTLNLDNYKKLDGYKIIEVKNNIVFIEDINTHHRGIRYIDCDAKIDCLYKEIKVINDTMFKVVDKDNNNLLIDYEGNTILNLHDKKLLEYKNGYVKYYAKDYYGIMDIHGNDILKCNYKNIIITESGFIVMNTDLLWGIIDFNGKMIIPFKYVDICYGGYGLFVVENKKNKTGIKDKAGKKIIKEKYKYIKVINDNMFYVINSARYIISKDEKIVYEIPDKYYPVVLGDVVALYDCGIRENNLIITDNVVINLKCDCISHSINGIRYMQKETKFYLTDYAGNIISGPYDDAYVKDNTIYLKKKGTWFYVDNDNNVVKCEKKPWDNYKVLFNCNDLVIANDDKTTMFFYNNNVINTNELYTDAYINGDYIICSKDFYYALYTKDGHCIIPLIKSEIFVISDHEIVIDNHIIDLSDEYLNFDIEYNLVVENNKERVIKTFDNSSNRDNYIKEIYKYSSQVNNEIKALNHEIKTLNNQIERLKSIDLHDMDEKVLKLEINAKKE